MVKKYSFERSDENALIEVKVGLKNDLETIPLVFALDTGASHTVIDLTALLLAGYVPDKKSNIIEVETGGGVVKVQRVVLPSFGAFGIQKENFEITTYDFMKEGLMSEYHGVLGLYFFQNTLLHIDFINSEIWVETV
ncbi:MAG: retropepsin-like aspartic protease [Chitinophagales bacterium]